jgi:glycosyltransferase 2 family protein
MGVKVMSEIKQDKSKRFKVGWLRYLLPIIIFWFAIHTLLPQITTLENTVKVLQSMSVWLVLLALVAEILSYMGNGYLLKVLVTLGKSKFSIFRGILIYMASSSIGLVAGGWISIAATTYYWVSKNEDVSSEEAALTGFIPNLYNDTLISILTFISMGYLLLIHDLTKLHIIIYSIVLFVSIMGNLIFIFGIFHRAFVERFILGTLGYIIRLFKRKYDPKGISNVLNNLYMGLDMLKKKGWRKPAVGSCMNIGFDMLCLYLIFIAAGYRIHIIVLIAGYGFSILIGMAAFFIPGGVGVVESSLVAIFTSLGVPAEISVIASLSYRLFSFWIPSILGFAVSGYLGGPREKTDLASLK